MERNKLSKELFYSIEDEPIVLSKVLLDILLPQENSSDLIALYCFYYYTAKWQKTDQPRATSSYVMSGLNWGEIRFIKAKRVLRELHLIQDVDSRGADGRVICHYIKLNFLWKNTISTTPLANDPDGETGSNALKTNNKSIFSEKHEKNIIPPSIKMVTLYCRERKNNVNPKTFIDFYSSKGWFIGKNKMKDWQAAVRTWEKNNQGNNPSNLMKGKPPFIRDPDKGRFDLCSDGEYRHCVSGEIYIP